MAEVLGRIGAAPGSGGGGNAINEVAVDVSAELIGIVAVGVSLGGLVVGLFVWVRSDVTGAEAGLGARIDGAEERLGARIDGAEERLGARIDRVDEGLGKRIDQVEERLGKRIDQVEERLGKRIDTLATDEAALARSVAWMQGAVGVRPGDVTIRPRGAVDVDLARIAAEEALGVAAAAGGKESE